MAIIESGELYAWGLGTIGQLGQGNQEDLAVPTRIMSQQFENRRGDPCVSRLQHSVLIAKKKMNTREIVREIVVCLHIRGQGHF